MCTQFTHSLTLVIFSRTDQIQILSERLTTTFEVLVMYHIQISSFGKSYPGWASSKSTVLCPSEANKVEPFEWKEETVQVECA